MMIGSILLVKRSSLISWIIRKLAKSKYSHAAISLTEDNSVVVDADSFRRVMVRKNIFETPEIIDVALTPKQKADLVDYLLKQCGVEYDYFQVLGFAIRILGLSKKTNLWDSQKRFQCIELVDRAYMSIGIDLLPNKLVGDALPSDLDVEMIKRTLNELEIRAYDQ